MIDFGEAVRRFYGNYTNPEGRSQRSAYWWVLLYQIIIGLVLVILVYMADGGRDLMNAFLEFSSSDEPEAVFEEMGVLWDAMGQSGKIAIYAMIIFGLVNFIPNIMLQIRRFHDINQSGWLVLAFFMIGLIPILSLLSGIANLIWFIFPGTDGSNQYGPDPLGHDTDIFG